MDIFNTVKALSINSYCELFHLEGSKIWLSFLVNPTDQKYASIYTEWDHGGLYGIDGCKITKETVADSVFCKHQSLDEYIHILDFFPTEMGFSINSICKSEEDAKCIRNMAVFVNDGDMDVIHSSLSESILNRKFTIPDRGQTSLFKKIEKIDPGIIKIILNQLKVN